MIEKMINELKRHLPLDISEISWDGTIFHMYGSNWNFNTLSAWRISTNSRIILGCYDNNSTDLIKSLKGVQIQDIEIQDNKLKIDPVFLLSDGQRLEIFSTDTFEPWVFYLESLGAYVPTPGQPFDGLMKD
jgi:hypothetical protein